MSEKPRKPTYKQELFILAYLGKAKGNAAKAAQMAGYTGNADTLKTQGCRTLTKAYVKARIEGRLAQADASLAEIMREITELAYLPLKQDEEGDIVSPPHHVQAKLKALEMLGRHHAAFTDVVKSADLPKDLKELDAFIVQQWQRVKGDDDEAEPVH